jgi:hypothetical protein
MTGATALNPGLVAARYTVTGSFAPDAAFTLAAYRSASRSRDPSQDTPLGTVTLTGQDLSLGAHTADVALAAPLDINPSQRYVLVAATPDQPGLEAGTNHDRASFRIWTIGGVTHGYSPTGQFQTWVADLAHGLLLDGYDGAVAYDWALTSALPLPGMATAAARGMALRVARTIESLPAHGFRKGDVVDVHLIGHSRGAGVVSLAAGLLATDLPSRWRGSLDFLKLTLLDPHPSAPTPVPYSSSSTGPLGSFAVQVYDAAQAAQADPPVVIPSRVNETEVFYQHTPVTGLTAQSSIEYDFLNYWGVVPVGASPGMGPIVYYNLTGLGLPDPSHDGPIEFYLSQVVPTLGYGGHVPIPGTTSPPSPPTDGGPLPGTGSDFESRALAAGGIDPLAALDTFNRALAQSPPQYELAQTALAQMALSVLDQRGQTIPTGAADQLLATSLLAEYLLIPRSWKPVVVLVPSSGNPWESNDRRGGLVIVPGAVAASLPGSPRSLEARVEDAPPRAQLAVLVDERLVALAGQVPGLNSPALAVDVGRHVRVLAAQQFPDVRYLALAALFSTTT